jgi:3-hydroxybutyryl-CoA dehydrogenase
MRIAVIGAGVMGGGIAQVLAQAGNEVQCTDIAEELLEEALLPMTTSTA